jgi:23S rRNA pseudouridine2605 synthase
LPARERTRLWIFHKPRGVVTTARDPEGRSTVFDILPEDLPRVVAIGRLDINTEGLLLLTNDGGLARVIAHPETGWMRRYRIRAYGDITQADLDRLKNGVTVDEMEYGPVEATLDRVQGDNLWITMGLREGKNREVKRILEHVGLQVNRLIRLSFGPFQLGDLEPGLVEEVKTKVLKEQLGSKLAEEAGVDFASPVREPIAPFGSPKKSAGPTPRARPVGRERPEQSDRGARGRPEGRFGDRPRFERPRGERPGGRTERGEGRGAPPGAARSGERPARAERPRSVWRDDVDPQARAGSKAPRRGADPREARAASAERPRERGRPIEVGEGRKVRVERLVSAPRDEEPRRTPRTERPGRGPSGEDRPRRHEDRGFSDRPPRRPAGDRPGRGGPAATGRRHALLAMTGRAARVPGQVAAPGPEGGAASGGRGMASGRAVPKGVGPRVDDRARIARARAVTGPAAGASPAVASDRARVATGPAPAASASGRAGPRRARRADARSGPVERKQ